MDMAPPSQVPDRRPSPGLKIELSSNNPFNPFRRQPSPNSPSLVALESPRSTSSAPSNRPVSRNPFLAAFEQENSQLAYTAGPTTPNAMDTSKKESPRKESFADELLKELSINDTKPREGSGDRPKGPPTGRSGALPVPPGHRPSHSSGDGHRRPPRPRGPPGSERSEHRRARRNSDSSLADKGSLTEEERKRRERHRERREREKAKGEKSRESGRSGGKSKRPAYVDVIDKMDVTGLYGPGLFHHDGPYDSLNPHRNRKKDTRAPMHAFAANSANMALGGSGPVNKNIDLEKIHGTGAEGFTDYNTTNDLKKAQGGDKPVAFDPKARVEILHGEETQGLGTSTFLEGAPASRRDMQRRESENEQSALQGAGLSRTKSLAQRLRGISQPRRYGDGRIMSPEARYGPRSPDNNVKIGAQSAGGMTKSNEQNPFFDDYDEAFEKKGTTIKIAEDAKAGRPRAPSSPNRGLPLLERRVTTDSAGEASKPSNGFLNRVKSLKGGKRRPEQRGTAI